MTDPRYAQILELLGREEEADFNAGPAGALTMDPDDGIYSDSKYSRIASIAHSFNISREYSHLISSQLIKSFNQYAFYDTIIIGILTQGEFITADTSTDRLRLDALEMLRQMSDIRTSAPPRYRGPEEDRAALTFWEQKYPADKRWAIDENWLQEHDPALLDAMRHETEEEGEPLHAHIQSTDAVHARARDCLRAALGLDPASPECDATLESITQLLVPAAQPTLGRWVERVTGERTAIEQQAPESPPQPPRWDNPEARGGRNAIQFLKEYYGEQIQAGTLTAPALRAADFKLYNSYQAFKSRHPDKVDVHLPTRSEVLQQELDDVPILNTDTLSARQYQRLRQASYRQRGPKVERS